ncbi:capsular polysaccharide biosynthesis protein [Ruegeria profundi]|nr:capsular polysaccharide biosynthesis protein [Ruegeria profundi]
MKKIRRLRKAPQWLTLFAQRLRMSATGVACDSLTTSMDLAQHPTLRGLLGFAPAFHSRLLTSSAKTYIGWGRKWSGRRAVAIAAQKGAEFTLLEDGFLRSVGRRASSLSLVFDDLGIYYDASAPSRLEVLIPKTITTKQEARAKRLVALWREHRLSKYNEARDYEGRLPESYVLVVDQVARDLSIRYGEADRAAFARMLRAALAEHPRRDVIVKLHPDALNRSGFSHFDVAELRAMPRVQVIAENCHVSKLIERAEVVYAVTSQVGFEALMWGKPVRCFGMPFYAGWGLTRDELPPPERRSKATLEQLVHAALIRYPRYLHPETKQPCEAEDVMAHIGLQRQLRQRFPGTVYAYGFSPRKRGILQRFMQGSDVVSAPNPRDIPADCTVVMWGETKPDGLPPTSRILRVEDGFLRSSGLGAELVPPISWALDDQGIYYDPTRLSRLETLLQCTSFDDSLIARARELRYNLLSNRITKYNLSGSATWRKPASAARVILVPGQVENDASIRCGGGETRTNLRLLELVRAANPDAHIVYKPHPDVVAGLRRSGEDEAGAKQFCNEIVSSGDMAGLLDQVDEVHTISSLSGFEALLRGLSVTCYGSPFYAGWGLTQDRCAIPRRTRKLSLDQLVAGALIAYPTYVSRDSGAFTTPERAVEELAQWRATGPGWMPFWRSGLRIILQAWVASGLRSNF